MSLSVALHCVSFSLMYFLLQFYCEHSSKQCFVIVPEGQHASFNDSQVSWSKFWKVILNKYYILLLFSNFT